MRARTVDRVRVRAGIGYRESFAWRFEALYIWTGNRNDQSGVIAVESHAIDLRVKHVF
jgi:hypothetical protein